MHPPKTESPSLHLIAVVIATAALGAAFPGCSTGTTCEELGNCPTTGATGGSDGGVAGSGGNTTGGTPSGAGGINGTSTTGSAGMDGTGGVADGGEGGTGGMGEDCDTTASPSDEPCLVSDDLSVFVSPDGDDDDDGTMDEPVESFARALELAAEDDKLVVACSGEYDEQIVIDDEVRIYGSFDCEDDWTYAPGEPSVVAPGEPGYALRIDGVDGEVVVEDVELVALDGEEPGESSVAGFVSESSDVTLRRVRLEAGSGVDGEDGELVPFAPGDFPDEPALRGNAVPSGDMSLGGPEKVCACPGGTTSTGGKGGDAATGGNSGEDGLPNHEDPGGEGGTPGSCATGLGTDGANAPDAPPADGAMTLGVLTSNGWAPASGEDGETGQPGQGGGGGASALVAGQGGGGGGGCGTCGGAGGPGGQGGGASIALLVFESSVTIEASELVAGDAGDGGAGAEGQDGDGDNPGSFGNGGTPGGCPGGTGGLGGNGASGGGGAGGISAGIVWKGETEPSVDDNTAIQVGDAGEGGEGGAPGDNDGIDGEAVTIIEGP
jgi:hypothetical protein